MKIEQKAKPVKPLTIGDKKPQKRFSHYGFLTKIGERILGALYINFKF